MLARASHEVRLWAREAEVIDSIRSQHVNEVFLPNSPLDTRLDVYGTIGDVVRDRELVVMAAPSHAMQAVAQEVGKALGTECPLIVSVAKGLEPKSLALLTDVLEEELPNSPVSALSGPSFA